jgi:hypothetical protein
MHEYEHYVIHEYLIWRLYGPVLYYVDLKVVCLFLLTTFVF